MKRKSRSSLLPDDELRAVPVWWVALALVAGAVVLTVVLGETEVARAPARRAAFLKRVNINTAGVAELDALPGIGPVMARAVVEGRPFATVEELVRVRGISAALVERLRPLIRASDVLEEAGR